MRKLLRNMAKAKMAQMGYSKINKRMGNGLWRQVIGAYPWYLSKYCIRHTVLLISSYSSTGISQYRFTVLRLIPSRRATCRWLNPAERNC